MSRRNASAGYLSASTTPGTKFEIPFRNPYSQQVPTKEDLVNIMATDKRDGERSTQLCNVWPKADAEPDISEFTI